MKAHICFDGFKRIAKEGNKADCNICKHEKDSFDIDLSFDEIQKFNGISQKFNSRPNFPIKNSDGKEHWISRSAAVNTTLIFILNGVKHVLIGQRGSGMMDKPNLWNLICGYLDWDEDGPSAVKREVFEETSLDLDDLKSRYDVIMDYTNQPWYIDTNTDANRQNISIHYALVLKGKELPIINFNFINPFEVADVKWIKISDLNAFEFAFNHELRIKQFIEKLDEKDELIDFTNKNFSYLIEKLAKLELNSSSENIIKKSLEQFEKVSMILNKDMWQILEMTTDRYKIERYKKLLNK